MFFITERIKFFTWLSLRITYGNMFFLLSTTVYKKRTKQRYLLDTFGLMRDAINLLFFISSFLFFVFNTFGSKNVEFSRLCRPSKNFTRRKMFFLFFWYFIHFATEASMYSISSRVNH